MTPLECEIIVGTIPAGAISRKGGSIWGMSANSRRRVFLARIHDGDSGGRPTSLDSAAFGGDQRRRPSSHALPYTKANTNSLPYARANTNAFPYPYARA